MEEVGRSRRRWRGRTSDSYFCIQCTPYITAPETTIEPPRKIFDALDMIDIECTIMLIRSTE